MREGLAERRLAAVMAASVVGYGRLMEANEEGTLEALRRHRAEFLDGVIADFGGRVFKDMSETLLVEFASAFYAIQCAVELQRGMAQRNAAVPQDRRIGFRIGLNLGDVIVKDGDLFGDDVNMAARIEGLAPPGGIACSAGIRHQIGQRLDLEFLDQGEKTVKNIVQPVQVFFINLDELIAGAASRPQPGRAAKVDPGKIPVAVLPFNNMSGDASQEYFSDGIAEDIIAGLSNVSGLFVLSRNAVFPYKDKATDIEQVARDLGVAYLVHGSVRKGGSKLRVTAQLIEAATGGHVWAERYDRQLSDIFALQGEISKTIVSQLQVSLLPSELQAIERAPTGNVEAYTCYLKGRELFHRGREADYREAKQMFAQAINLDPSFARAYAGLADCDAFLFMDYSQNVAPEVFKNSEMALALDPTLNEAHASRGLALSLIKRYEEAEREFELAIARGSDHYEARYYYGRSFYAQGKFAETAVQWERAAEMKPDDYQTVILLNQVYTSLNRPEEAMRAGIRGVDRAERAFAKDPSNPRPAYFIATTLAKIGETARAMEWAAKALELAPDDYLTRYNIACFYSVLGDADRAFALIDELLPLSNADMKEWMLSDSDFAPLHADPRWKAVEDQARIG